MHADRATETTPGVWALPWHTAGLTAALQRLRGHAVLVHASPGAGALEFAFGLALGWLCEGTDPGPPGAGAPIGCGRCASCRLARSDSHPDLKMLLPETLRIERGLPVEAQERRKPSRQIRIAEVRDGIDWITRSSARGRAKVMLVHPAPTLNVASASALLKTLEEPPGAARIVLTASDPTLLMPTVISRCHQWRVPPAPKELALQWLVEHGLADAEARTLLQATGDQPLEALAWHRDGVTAQAWASLPAAVARDDAAALSGWAPARVLEAMLKLCHDAAMRTVGAEPRFFPANAVSAGATQSALMGWHKSLLQVARHADHPWNEPLLVEALVAQGAQALAPAQTPGPRRRGVATLTS